MEKNCFIVILEAKVLLLLGESYDALKCIKTNDNRDRLYSIYRTIAPDAVERRTRDMQRHRKAYIVPGPNFVWSIDGYMKLEPYGIEIYAGIDAYARYIIWTYVGITARTEVSVLKQFLDVVEDVQLQSRIVRSDQGPETVLLAEAHHRLLRAYDPNIPLEECYYYGTGVKNQRIEAWWTQLAKEQLFKWRVSKTFLIILLYKTCLQ